jgi:hypothetical protein
VKRSPTLRATVARLLRTAYFLAIQSLVGLLTLGLFAHFAVNSPSAAARLSRLVSAVIPGTLTLESLHWGPGLGTFSATGLDVRAPNDRRVLAARRIEADVGVARLGLALATGNKTLPVRISRLHIDGAELYNEVDRKGRLLLNLAFADPDAKPEPGRPLRLDLDDCWLTGARYVLNVPAMQMDVRGIDARGSAQVHTSGDDVHVGWQLRDVVGRSVAMSLVSMRDLPPIPHGWARAERVDGTLDGTKLRGVDMALTPAKPWYDVALPDSVVLGARMDVLLRPEFAVDASQLRLETSTRSPFIGPMLGPLFDCQAGLVGGFHWSLPRGFVAEADVAGSGLMSGFVVRRAKGHVAMDSVAPGHDLVWMRVTGLEVLGYGGRITSPWLDYRMDKDSHAHDVRGRFQFTGLSPGGLLTAPGVGLTGNLPVFMDGALDGDLGVWTRTLLTQDGVEFDLALDGETTLARTRSDAPLREVAQRLHLRGGFLYAQGPQRGIAMDLNDALLSTCAPRPGRAIDDAGLQRCEYVRADGHLDLTGDKTRLLLAAHVPKLERMLAPLGLDGYAGRIELERTAVDGSLRAPTVMGELRLYDVITPWVKVPRAKTVVLFERGVLQLQGMHADTSLGRIAGEVEAALLGRTFQDKPARRTVKLRKMSLDRLDLGSVLPSFGVPGIKGLVSLQQGAIELDLDRPLDGLHVQGRLMARGVEAYGEKIPLAVAKLGMHGRRVAVDGLCVRLDAADAQHCDAQKEALRADTNALTGAGDVDLQSLQWRAQVRMPVLPFDTWYAVRKLEMPLRGAIGGKMDATGDLRDFKLDAALDLAGLGWDKIELGDAKVQLAKARGGPLDLRAAPFFPRFKLLAGSQVAFQGLQPTVAKLLVATVGSIDPAELMGAECAGKWLGQDCAAGASIKTDLRTETVLDLRPGHVPYEVLATMRPGGFQADFGGGLPPLQNVARIEVAAKAGIVTWNGAQFDLGRDQLELCGEYRYGQTHEVLAFATGTLDLQPIQRLYGLQKVLSALDLRLTVLPHPDVAQDPRADCLQSFGAKRAALRVEGRFDDLRVTGSVRTEQGRIAMRRLPDLQVAEGGRMDFESRGSKLKVTIPRTAQLAAAMEDGKAWLWGEVELVALQPERADVHFDGLDLPVPGVRDLSAVVSPALRFVGKALSDPVERDMRLEGSLEVNEANFKSDKVEAFLGGVKGREIEASSKPLSETMPALCDLKLDLVTRGRNVDLALKLGVARTEMLSEFDLRIGGTPCDPKIRDRVRLVPGADSVVVLAVNNATFEVERGTLDFTGDPARPYVDLQLRADIKTQTSAAAGRLTGLGRDLSTDTVGDTSQKVGVRVRVEGYLTGDTRNLKVHFESDAGDSEADVQSLILTGRRRSEAGTAGGGIQTDLLVGEIAKAGASRVATFVQVLGEVVPFMPKIRLDQLLDDVHPYYDTANGLVIEASKKLGRVASVGARVVGLERDTTSYTANFQFRFLDNLSFAGLLKRTAALPGAGQKSAGQQSDVFEGKLRWKVPLD